MIMGIAILLLAVTLIILARKGKIYLSRDALNFSAAVISLLLIGTLFILCDLGIIPAY